MTTDNAKKAAFKAWFNQRWAEWDAVERRRTTQQELADYLGIKRASVAQYVSGKQLPEGVNVFKIARKFGDEVYALLGVEPDNSGVIDDLGGLPASEAEDFRALFAEIKAVIEDAGVAPDSEEGVAISRRITEGWLANRMSKR